MSSHDLAISIRRLSKAYSIGANTSRRQTFGEAVVEKLKRPLGRSAPTTFWALKDVSFDVKKGEVVGIIGRNGAGKSTLLKVLSRITEPTAGKIKLYGRIGSLLEVGTGFHPELSGRENIYLNGAVLGMSRSEIRREFDNIVAFAEVEKFLDTPVKRYSSGMYVRLAFSVAAHLNPEILIVDEVLAVGDAEFQRKCLGKMGEVAAGGRTVLFVSHNMAAVCRLCKACIQLSHGQIVAHGPTQEIARRYMDEYAEADESADLTSAPESHNTGFELIRCRLHDEMGQDRDGFTTSEPVVVAIHYRLRKNLPGLRVGFDLLTIETGEVLFRAFDDDLECQHRTPGEYTACANIPRHLLKPGKYVVRLQVGIHNVRWLIDGTARRTFTIEHLGGVNAAYGDPRPGLIMPLVNWATTAAPVENLVEAG